MDFSAAAERYLRGFLQAGEAPITDQINIQTSNENPLPGEEVTITWQGNGGNISLTVNGVTILNNQPSSTTQH